ncbi:MAG: hypothetical protein ACE1ZF_01020, partial [Gemmatimonadales bacterium]
RENWEDATRYDRSVLEPEIKEIAVDDEVVAWSGYLGEETLKRCRGVVVGLGAQVGVGDDDGGMGWHGGVYGSVWKQRNLLS